MILKNTKIYIAGHKGMVGSAIWRLLEQKGYKNLIGRTSKELDLKNQTDVQAFFNTQNPAVVIDAAAKVGGILANNDYPYQFLMENMQIQNNLIDALLHQEVEALIGDPSKAKNKLGWVAEHDLGYLVKDMMRSDIILMKKEQYLKDGGYSTLNYFE